MSIKYDKIVVSDMFEFVIGPDKKIFRIHKALAAHLSPILGMIMLGPMREAHKGRGKLKDVDEQTFIWFCEYAYTKDYAPRSYDKFLDSATLANDVVHEYPHFKEKASFSEWGTSKKDKKWLEKGVMSIEQSCDHCGHKLGKQILWNEFENYQYSTSLPIHKNKEEHGDFTNILGHARMYVFADKYDITNLRMLALAKLHEILKTLHVYSSRVSDVIELVRYSYSNNNTRDSDGEEDMDSMRKLVVHYVACLFDDIARDDRFLVLMEDGGPFVKDLTRMLLRTI